MDNRSVKDILAEVAIVSFFAFTIMSLLFVFIEVML